jgi:hypothetical protein
MCRVTDNNWRESSLPSKWLETFIIEEYELEIKLPSQENLI